MTELRSSFMEEGELVLGEYTYSEAELDYLKDVPREEAGRALADMGAAAVLLDNESFTNRDLVVGEYETLPLELSDGDVIARPGAYVSWGIKAAQQSLELRAANRRKIRKAMTRVGLTAHLI